MANLYSPDQLGIKPPSGGFQQGGWYNGRQYWGGTLSDPGVIHPQSNQQGAGSAVSGEVNAQSAAAQGVSTDQFNQYLQDQQQQAANINPVAQAVGTPNNMAVNTKGSAGAAGAMGSITPQPAIDLQQIYGNLYNKSGISDKEGMLTEKEKQYLEAKAKIMDNPFLDAATVDKRLQRLQNIYNTETSPLKNEIATKKADIETQLNLQMKQFDINSEVAQQALNQFNSLLESGALSGASGDDIANITRTTGLSSSMIQSAIDAQKAKNVKTETIKWDDGVNQGYAIVNSQTGEIINKQAVAASEPKSTSANGSGRTKTQESQVVTAARQAIVDVDDNEDKSLSRDEFSKAVQILMTKANLSQPEAEEYVAQAFSDLGYQTWKWSK